MAKVEIDLLDPSLDNSGDGDDEILGMVDDSQFGGSEPDKKLLESGGDDMSYTNYYRDPPGNTVTYRLVMSQDEASGNSSLQSQSHYSSASVSSNGQQSQPIPTVLANSVNGQLYVIGNSEMFSGSSNKQSISRDSHGKVTTILKKRDDRRRATHNEVERRRRDKINSWILKLDKLIPRNDVVDKIVMESKGGILAKACEYITELKENEDRVEALEKTNKKMASELATLMLQVKALKKTNMQMRTLLSQQGITFHSESSDSGS